MTKFYTRGFVFFLILLCASFELFSQVNWIETPIIKFKKTTIGHGGLSLNSEGKMILFVLLDTNVVLKNRPISKCLNDKRVLDHLEFRYSAEDVVFSFNQTQYSDQINKAINIKPIRTDELKNAASNKGNLQKSGESFVFTGIMMLASGYSAATIENPVVLRGTLLLLGSGAIIGMVRGGSLLIKAAKELQPTSPSNTPPADSHPVENPKNPITK